MRGYLRVIVLVFGLGCVGGCVGVITPDQTKPPSGNTPSYKKIIGEALTKGPIIIKPEQFAPYEISTSARQVDALQGWSWLVCLKGIRSGLPIYFAMFIQNDHVVNVRTSVRIDDCGHQPYEPFAVSFPRPSIEHSKPSIK
jgi:hypothetical protein